MNIEEIFDRIIRHIEQEKPSRKGKANKRKGKRGERVAAAFFGDLIFDDPKAFIPAPASGAWSVFRGDIAINQSLSDKYAYSRYKFVVEVKNDERFTLDVLAKNPKLCDPDISKNFLGKALKQLADATNSDAASYEIPFAFISKNYYSSIIAVPTLYIYFPPEAAPNTFIVLTTPFISRFKEWTLIRSKEFLQKVKNDELVIWWDQNE